MIACVLLLLLLLLLLPLLAPPQLLLLLRCAYFFVVLRVRPLLLARYIGLFSFVCTFCRRQWMAVAECFKTGAYKGAVRTENGWTFTTIDMGPHFSCPALQCLLSVFWVNLAVSSS